TDAGCIGLLACLRLGASNEDASVFGVPSGNLMAPPQLARNTPVLDFFQPLIVGGSPVFRVELDAAIGHDLQGDIGNAFAWMQSVGRRSLAHGNKPLVREHGLDNGVGAIAAWNHEFVRLDCLQRIHRGQVFDYALARFEAIKAAIGSRGLVADLCVQCQDADHTQAVALSDRVVVEIVRGRDFDDAGAELTIDIVIGNNGNMPAHQWQFNGCTY